MIEGGYVLLPRKLLESDVYKTSPCIRELWLFLIINTSYKRTKNLKRGQIRTNFNKIKEQLSWKIGYRKESYSNRQLEGAAKVLVKEGMIVATKVVHGMLITICNYDIYQDPKNYESSNESSNEKLHEGRAVGGNENKKEEVNSNTVRLKEKKSKKNDETKINGNPNSGSADYFGRYGDKRPADYLGAETYKPR